jgi:hypothetical protein
MNGRASALMVNLRNGFRPRVYAVGLAATLFRSPDRRPSFHCPLANRLQLTVPRAPVPLETCVSGLAVVGIALPLAATNDTASDLLFTTKSGCNNHTEWQSKTTLRSGGDLMQLNKHFAFLRSEPSCVSYSNKLWQKRMRSQKGSFTSKSFPHPCFTTHTEPSSADIYTCDNFGAPSINLQRARTV